MILGTSALPRFQIPGARADHQTPERSRQEASIVDMRKKQKSDSQHAGDGYDIWTYHGSKLPGELPSFAFLGLT